MCALDEPGKVRDHERLLVRLLADGDYAEVGLEGREGVIGDFGLGSGDARDQRGFAGIGVADESDVGKQLEFQAIDAFFAGAAQLVLARSLVSAGGKVLVASTATT